MGSAARFRQDWFEAYVAAILEADVERIPERVVTARNAIAERVVRLEAGDPAGTQEPRDLRDALSKLQILLNVSREVTSTLSYSHFPSSPEQPRLWL
jgi:hypothetical protein